MGSVSKNLTGKTATTRGPCRHRHRADPSDPQGWPVQRIPLYTSRRRTPAKSRNSVGLPKKQAKSPISNCFSPINSSKFNRINSMKYLFIIFFSIILSAPKSSSAKSAYELMVYCKKAVQAEATGKTDDPAVTYCIGLVEGVSRTMAYTQYNLSRKLSKDEKICFPRDMTTGQLIHIVVADIESLPKAMHIDAVVTLMDIFEQNFRCKINNK
jgi:Rap1a immunity proteins